MPREQTLSHTRGDDFAWKEGVANLTTDQIAEAWFTVRTSSSAQRDTTDDSATTQVSMNGQDGVPIGITIVDSTTLLVAIPAAQTALWTRTSYVYDLAIRTLAGKEYTLTRGVLSVAYDVTKSI